MLARAGRWFIASMLVAGSAGMLDAQVMSVSPGTPVRLALTGPGNVILTGWIERLQLDTLDLLGQVPRGLPGGTHRVVHWQVLISEIDSLQVREGTYAHTGLGAVCGAVAGIVAGAAVGFSSGSDARMSAQTKAAEWGLSFGVLGAGVGGLIGSRTRDERWISVPPTLLRVEPVAPRAPGVTVSLTVHP